MAKSSGGTRKKGDAESAGKDTGKDAKKTSSSRSKKDSASKKKAAASKKTPSKKAGASKGKTKKTAPEKVDDQEKPKEKNPRKSPVLKCQFCQKTMRDRKTLKVHERNCQLRKDKESEKKLEDAILIMKDDFKEERQNLIDRFQSREDALQRELDEMRTVMRMEIDRHRKELDMIRKVEKEVHEAVENHDVSQSRSEPEPMAVMEASPPKDAPRAIDMIPTPLPDIPRRIIEPIPAEEPAQIPEKGPVQDKTLPAVESVRKKSSGSGEGTGIIAESVYGDAGMTREAVEALVRSMVQDMAVEATRLPAGELPQLEDFKHDFNQVRRRMDAFDSKLERYNSDMKRSMDKLEKGSDIKRLERELAKISDRIFDMMEDIGFAEDLSVTKIPPTILEIVYQATLDDILQEIVRSKGPQDAEKIASQSLEEVRLKTSGSELFKFDGRKIVTDNLARSIEANRISAKQIQTTYNVLLDRLLETVPHHKAKNFRGMIKVKSQEFAVDKATVLTKEFNRMERVLESTSQMVAAISAQINARNLEINEMFDDIRNNLLAGKAGQEELELLRLKMQERDERIAGLDSELALLKAELKMKEQIIAKEEREEPAIIVPGETIDSDEIIGDSGTGESGPMRDITADVLSAIRDGASSKTAIIRRTGFEEEAVLNAVFVLVGEKKVTERKMGRRIKYMTPEQEMDEKLRAADKKKASGKKGKKADTGPDMKSKHSPRGKTVEKPSVKKAEKKDSPAKPEAKPVEKATKEEPKPEPAGKAKKKPVKKESSRPAKEPVKKEKTKKIENKKPAPKKDKKKSDSDSSSKEESKKEKPAPRKRKTGSSGENIPSKERDAAPPKKESAASGGTAQPKSVKKKDAKPENEPDKKSAGKEKHLEDELPVITRKLEDLSDDERRVLGVISKDGMSISGIQSKIGKDMKRFALLRALRVLIDSGYVGILSKGRMELYQKINVKKVDKKNKNKQEVKS